MSINSKHHCDFTGSAIAVTISHNIRTAPRSHQRATRPQYLGESCSISAINFRVRLCVGPEIPLPPLASFGWEIQLYSCICLRSLQSAETLLPIASWGRGCFFRSGKIFAVASAVDFSLPVSPLLFRIGSGVAGFGPVQSLCALRR